MIRSNNTSNRFVTGLCTIFIISLLLFFYFVNDTYIFETRLIIFSFAYLAILYLATISKEKEIDIFHPIHLVTITYLCIFIFTPLLLINQGRANCWGVNVMLGCTKATIVFNLSYTFYIIGYTKLKITDYTFYRSNVVSESQQSRIVLYSTIIWLIGFILAISYLLITGRSISYILTLGNSGNMDSQNGKGDLLFLSNFTLFMVTPLLYLFKFSKSKSFFALLGFLTFSTMYIRGFRIFILILIISLFIVYFKGRLKKPSFKILMPTFIVMIFFLTFLGTKRKDLRSGNKQTTSEINSGAISDMMESNFEIYKPFYGLVVKYNETYAFTLGKSMVWDTIINWIPRAIWPGKPLAADQTQPIGIKQSVNTAAIDHGAMSWPNIGEFYMEFGTIGCCILFYYFGFGSKYLTKYYYSKNSNHLFIYAVTYPILFQFMIRGAFSQLLPFVVFTTLPFFLLKNIVKIKF